MPLNVTSAKAILFDLPLFFNWQSTLDVLKDPPTEYVEKVQPPVDLLAGLDDISARVDDGSIASEYGFGWELYKLVGAAHDGHFAYILDVVGQIFTFSRPLPLVSVSEDGSKLPAVLTTARPPEFLEELSQQGSLQDRDALYNNLFYNLAQISLQSAGSGTGGFSGGGRGRFAPPGANTTLEFANGTTLTIANTARTLLSFANVTSGEDLRRKIIYDEGSTVPSVRPNLITPVSRDTIPSTQAIAPPGYPAPVVAGPSNLINGFYIDGTGYEDVAVLQVPSFISSSFAEAPFQAASQNDLFKQLFPALDPYGANRFRYNEAVDLVGQAFSGVASQYPREAGLRNSTLRAVQSSYFDYHTDTTVDGKPFESWSQKVGPISVNGQYYTALSRWNLTDIYIPYQAGINVTGFSNLTRWKPEDIVLVTDGYCASTCSIFAELMTQQGGVKTIAMGGRSNANKIQAVGGVKGANIFQWGFIQTYAAQAKQLNNTLRTSALKEYDVGKAVGRSYADGINVRDAVRLGDESGIALQFKYEEANCRLYYTAEMTVNAAAIWKAAANAQWKDSSKCIGNGGYYPSNAKRAAQGKTTTLSPARGYQVHGVQALRQYEALEGSFSVETEYQRDAGDGFMQP
ncbi:uncharacterized protein N0V89_009289 [Didymosphaeria variabile]|uniref:CPAF-like PDZ domain-containing protein n=1 Tax=Didymosphaeria variabile TaxID=1932322 RepID=A0A9W8XD77_9PLEO|nr:uncharacterized protein N0V89_009289 [Didymosphaeria variabile]KAJ4347917.1 hypothetical protein N0V89_009289 [Didymosphaeria variabile]